MRLAPSRTFCSPFAEWTNLCSRLSHYDRVCPSYKRKVFTVQSEEHPNGELKLLADGQERIHQLQVLLLGSDELCVSVVGDLFDES